MSSAAVSPDVTDVVVAVGEWGRNTGARPHRLAFLCHPYHRGGVTQWMRDAAVEFAARGYDVDFVTVRPRTAFASAGVHPILADLVPTSPTLRVHAPLVGAAFELGTERYRSSVYQSAFMAAVDEGTPVVVSNDAAGWHAAAAMASRNPAIGVLHADEDAYYELAERHVETMSALVCVSERIARITRARLGNASPPTWVVPCGIVLRPFLPANGAETAATGLIWVGRIEQRQKRVLDLPPIAQRVASTGGDVTLSIIGDGPEQQTLRDAMRFAPDVQVRWRGWLDANSVREELARADVLLLPSAFEGMPLVVMEALSEGCSVVSSEVSGVEDLARHSLAGNCLWTHPPGDIETAAELVQRAIRIPRHARRAAARKLAEAECSLGVCVDRYEQVLPLLRPAGGNGRLTGRLSHVRVAALSLPIAVLRQVRLWIAGARL